MKYIDEFRKSDLIARLSDKLHHLTTQSWTIMEVCGGQTHAIMQFGLHDLLPQKIRLIHGPGCPVCVTAADLIDQAIWIAAQPHTILCSFADMLRVPGSHTNLLAVRAQGFQIQTITSPLDAVTLAQKNPNSQIVLFAIGFETTAPATAMAVFLAKKLTLNNFFLLVAHVLVPPALQYMLDAPGNEVQGFLAAGHVCTITGYEDYETLAKKNRTPIVVTGFEPADILQGLCTCVEMLEKQDFRAVNAYERCVQRTGNRSARDLMKAVFKVVGRNWRGIGFIASSGLALNEEYAAYDAQHRFPINSPISTETNGCISGQILQGKKRPNECPFFGHSCTPQNPIGAPMVSSEGACAAYYHYNREKL